MATAEYTVYIDSSLRDITKYPNPFRFVVEFEPLSDSTNVQIPLSVREVISIRFRSIILPLRLVPSPGERYFILRVKELDIPFHYHCDPVLNNNTDLVLYNSGVGGTNLYLDCRTDIRFPVGSFPRLRKLTFEFLDCRGQPLIPRSNMTDTDIQAWNLFYPHLSCIDDDNEVGHLLSIPELDPKQSMNNTFIEVVLVGSHR